MASSFVGRQLRDHAAGIAGVLQQALDVGQVHELLG